MSATKFNAGAPAHASSESWRAGNMGLTKREHMATAIMAGLCANPGGPYQANGNSGWGIVNCAMHDIANEAVNLADALLSALTATTQPDTRDEGAVR